MLDTCFDILRHESNLTPKFLTVSAGTSLLPRIIAIYLVFSRGRMNTAIVVYRASMTTYLVFYRGCSRAAVKVRGVVQCGTYFRLCLHKRDYTLPEGDQQCRRTL